jgi:ribosomal protein L15
LLGNGSINSKIEIEVTAASSNAKKAIEKVNGKISILLENIKETNKSVDVKN